MTTNVLFGIVGGLLFAIGFYRFFASPNLLRKVLAFNVMGSGVFLILVSGAYRGLAVTPDPVPHTVVLTGVVVAVSATAVFISLANRISDGGKSSRLAEDRDRD